uniref:C3H1-type domain-containing protein n=1 Tax=Macrostomum lignano TaxID=282301 RepID=A0A1I8H0W1_9PLAT
RRSNSRLGDPDRRSAGNRGGHRGGAAVEASQAPALEQRQRHRPLFQVQEAGGHRCGLRADCPHLHCVAGAVLDRHLLCPVPHPLLLPGTSRRCSRVLKPGLPDQAWRELRLDVAEEAGL